MNIRFDVGDWSLDGHEKCETFYANTDKDIRDVREAHFSCPEVFGFEIGDICSDYEDCYLSDEFVETFLSSNNIELPDSVVYSEGEYTLECEDVFCLWLNILNAIDPSLNLTKVVANVPTIHFYGHDEKGRHLSTPGYGCFYI